MTSQRAVVPPAAPVTPAGNGGGFYRAISLTLPWPPSVNGYWRRNGGRYFISKQGQQFRKAVLEECQSMRSAQTLTGRLSVTVGLNPPDKRKRDIDNVGGKALLDALGHAGVYADDSQIDRLLIVRGGVRPPGCCTVLVEEIA